MSRRRGEQPRLLVLEGALRENGGLRVSHSLVREWTREGIPSALLVLENVPPDVPMFTPSPEISWVYASGKERRFRSALPYVLAGLWRYSRSADVVISGSEVGWQLLLGRIVTRVLRRPFVTLVQSPLGQAIDDWQPARLRPALRWANRTVDRAVCVSPGLVHQVVENGLDPAKVTVVAVGIDVDDVARRGAAAARPVGSPRREGPPVIVGMGRLTPAKGFDLLLQASAKLLAEGLDHRIRIIGEGPMRTGLEATIEELGLRDVVELLGFVSEPQALLAGADLFVLPSRHEGNGGLVLLEALAHGRPIVAADCETGPRHVLRDGELGDLVSPEDPDALAGALGAFLRDPAPLRARALGGPLRARDFDQATAARTLYRYLRETVPLRGTPPTP